MLILLVWHLLGECYVACTDSLEVNVQIVCLFLTKLLL